MKHDDYYMQKAIDCAKQGLFNVRSNPAVGCIIVDPTGNIIASGAHLRYGQAHAEKNALLQINHAAQLEQASIYLTLEPCTHKGKQPPCIDLLRNTKIKRAVIAMKDPFSLVSGRGIKILKDHNIDVSIGCLTEEAFDLCPGFLKRQVYGLPWVRLKAATSLDGKMCFSDRRCERLTGEQSRIHSHFWRARSQCILTGIGTILCDNPDLDVRYEYSVDHQPCLAILDSQLQTPLSANCLKIDRLVYIFHRSQDQDKIRALSQIENISLIDLQAFSQTRINLQQVMHILAKQYKINDILVEAGPQLTGAFIEEELFDDLLLYTAPIVLGPAQTSISQYITQNTQSWTHHLELKETRSIENDLFCLYRRNTGRTKELLEYIKVQNTQQ